MPSLPYILDSACAGPLYLRQPEIAKMVVDAIHYREQLITPRVQVFQVMQSLKRFTAREGNRMLGLTGQPFWQD